MGSIKNIFSSGSTPIMPPYKKKGSGSNKIVYVRADMDQHKHAFYTPNKAFFRSREKTVLAELTTINNVNESFKDKDIDTSNVAIHWKLQPKEKRIKKKITIKVGYSKNNLEEIINDPAVSLTKRISFLRNTINGLLSLHRAGFIHKDLKPENLLVFDTKIGEGEIVKLSDFGHCVPIGEEGNTSYEGNTRFVAPDGGLTPESEVFSLALILIRGFEGILKDPVMEVPRKERDCKAHRSRVGLDKFLLEHKAFICYENKGASFGRIKNYIRRNKMNKQSADKKAERCEAQEQVLTEYIKKMTTNISDPEKLVEGQKCLELDKAMAFSQLLESMVQKDPKSRPTMSVVLERYNAIFPPE